MKKAYLVLISLITGVYCWSQSMEEQIINIEGQLSAITIFISNKEPISANEIKRDSGVFSQFGSIQDIDGNIYATVKIGEQIWMAENLKTSRYNDGTAIPLILEDTTWQVYTSPAYFWYDSEENIFPHTYGALYNGYAASGGEKNICPAGWHIPTDAEWTVLTTYLGGDDIAGSKLKEKGSTNWKPYRNNEDTCNSDATNETGFSALPGGLRHEVDGQFFGQGTVGIWWSLTENGLTEAWVRIMHCNNSYIFRHSFSKIYGSSVRCLKD